MNQMPRYIYNGEFQGVWVNSELFCPNYKSIFLIKNIRVCFKGS